MKARRFDVVCRVVDNYGDAGVCWRLARALKAEHALDVTLWIDQLATLSRLEPAIDPRLDAQSVAHVTVRRLDEGAPSSLPDAVVEAFGCGLPQRYLDAMAAASQPPMWFNLEYLSAEPWVDTAHALASAHPRLPLTRYFWFPGFTAKTGGLLRERRLLESRRAWRRRARQPREGVRIVLFCYPNRALPALFDAWAEGDEPVTCVVPEGVATAALDLWLAGDVPHAGQRARRGRLVLEIVPFMAQDAFDRLLWDGDVNFVRGEDSFVRAQWAARPLVWQPYPQAEDAHLLKLDAFATRYVHGLGTDATDALRAFWQAFNVEEGAAAAAAWAPFRATMRACDAHAGQWAEALAGLPELAAGMVEFWRARL